MEERKMTEEGNEEARREAALAASPLLQAGFKSSKVTQSQIDKLIELHQRRLQIKESSKVKTKAKGNARKSLEVYGKDQSSIDSGDMHGVAKMEHIDQPLPKDVACLATTTGVSATRKRQKLYWGLDTKERWERKSNM